MSRFLLDTNVVSEPQRPRPAAPVLARLAAADSRALHLSAVSLGELAIGVADLPDGRRRRDLELWLADLTERQFAGGLLPFDPEAARLQGELAARARALGRPPGFADGQIAATAVRHGMTVVTRDVRDFAASGVALVNPWDTPGPAEGTS